MVSLVPCFNLSQYHLAGASESSKPGMAKSELYIKDTTKFSP